MNQKTFLVFGGTGRTGRHFVDLALRDGHRVRVLARDPARLTTRSANLEVIQGVLPRDLDLDALLAGSDYVAAMLGDVQLQQTARVNTLFAQNLIPAMRKHGIARLLYQVGGLSAPPGQRLPPQLQAIRKTLARGYNGQHEDNEAVMRYLAADAPDIEWIVHRAGIGSDGPSKGTLQRSPTKFSVATFRDCAAYNYRILADGTAIRTCDFSRYSHA